jgi:Superfamily I DNA and RNA helicases
MDNSFQSEQKHLTMVHQTLQATLTSIEPLLANNAEQAKDFKKTVGKETALNFDSYADNLDTFAAIETMNKQIDSFNNKQTQLQNTKARVLRLLPAPYFARIDLKYPDETTSIPFYIGSAGFSPTPEEPMIIDWRSPIADLYYNNQIGATHYLANERKIDVSVDKRRQFILHNDVLENLFDTDVALQDPLLIKTLQANKNSQMSSITATIQKEQNVIIRDTDSPALLVNGIAGSGKTSVVLQRIAYLLYRYRENLVANEMLLLTPNQLFTDYIKQVFTKFG